MSRSPFSSGDAIADRRLARARDHAVAGEPAVAAELVEQALERVEDWAAGWFLLGEWREAAGDTPGAIAALERALALDPDDRCGAVLRLARLGARAAPDVPPPAHVRALFDAYAPRFEESLVGRLGYRGCERLAEAIASVVAERRFARGLDLGCGTGLMARALAGRVDRLEGVDLAPAMVAAARATGLYAALAVGEVGNDLARRADAALDLVTAADVFCYFGDLGAVVAEVARVLAPDGVFAFSVEADGEGDTVRFTEGLRWAHGRGHVERVARAAGLSLAQVAVAVLRSDRDRDLMGFFVVLTKS